MPGQLTPALLFPSTLYPICLPKGRRTRLISCGVFVCFYAYHFISSGALPTKAAFNTAPEKGPANFRKHIAQTLHLAAMDAINWPVSAFLCVYQPCGTGSRLQLPQLDQPIRSTRANRAAHAVTLPRSLHVFLPTPLGFYYPFNTNQTEGQNGTTAADAGPTVIVE